MTVVSSRPRQRYGRKSIEGYRSRLTVAIKRNKDGSIVEVDWATADALLRICDQLLAVEGAAVSVMETLRLDSGGCPFVSSLNPNTGEVLKPVERIEALANALGLKKERRP